MCTCFSGFWRRDNAIPVDACRSWELFSRKLPNDIICEVIAMKGNKGFLMPSYLPYSVLHPNRISPIKTTTTNTTTVRTSNLTEAPPFPSHPAHFCRSLNIRHCREIISESAAVILRIPSLFFACDMFHDIHFRSH